MTALEIQDNVVEEYMKGDLKLTMWIPSDLAGKVIGKKGVVISNLKRETKVELINALQPIGNSLWVPVVILGKFKPITAAYNEISRMVFEEVDDVVLEWVVNFKKPFFLTPNRRTSFLQKLSADTNVRIYYPEAEHLERNFAEPFTLEGSFSDVQRAFHLLEKEAAAFKEWQAQQPQVPIERKYKEREFTKYKAGPEAQKFEGAPKQSDAPLRSLQRHQGNASDGGVTPVEPEKTTLQHPPSSSSESTVMTDSKHNENKIETAATAPLPLPPSHVAPATAPSSNLNKADPAATSGTTPVVSEADKKEAEIADNAVPANQEIIEKEKDQSNAPKKGERIEKAIDVPSSIVGLLLSRGPQINAVTVINQVQRLTSTFISKIPSPRYSGKKKGATAAPAASAPAAVEKSAAPEAAGDAKKPSTKPRRRKASSDDEDNKDNEGEVDDGDDNDDDDEDLDDEQDDEEDDEDEEDDTGGNEQAKEGNKKAEAAAEVVEAYPDEVYPVTFRILSFAEENVDAAVSLLQRMIDGERIREVLESARTSTRSLTQFGDRICELYSASAQPGGRSSKSRPERPERRSRDGKDRDRGRDTQWEERKDKGEKGHGRGGPPFRGEGRKKKQFPRDGDDARASNKEKDDHENEKEGNYSNKGKESSVNDEKDREKNKDGDKGRGKEGRRGPPRREGPPAQGDRPPKERRENRERENKDRGEKEKEKDKDSANLPPPRDNSKEGRDRDKDKDRGKPREQGDQGERSDRGPHTGSGRGGRVGGRGREGGGRGGGRGIRGPRTDGGKNRTDGWEGVGVGFEGAGWDSEGKGREKV